MGQAELRTAAISADSTARSTIRNAEIWARLVSGERVVADSFYFGPRLFLILRTGLAPSGRAGLRGVRRNVLEDALLGKSHKVIALELGASASGVSTLIRGALETLGWSCAPSKVPLAAVMLAYAAHNDEPSEVARFSRLGRSYEVASIVRADLVLPARLPESVDEVVRRLVDGRSYAEIARERRVSERTVANQIAAAYRRLGISGRLELLVTIAKFAGARGPAALARAAT